MSDRRIGVPGVLMLVVLVLLAVGRSAWGTRLDSFTVDEPYHVTSGVSYWRTGDFRLNPEHPPLVRLWAGAFFPASSFFLPPLVPLVNKVEERDFTEQAVFLHNDGDRVQARARIAMWSLHGLLLFVLGMLLWQAIGLVGAPRRPRQFAYPRRQQEL